MTVRRRLMASGLLGLVAIRIDLTGLVIRALRLRFRTTLVIGPRLKTRLPLLSMTSFAVVALKIVPRWLCRIAVLDREVLRNSLQRLRTLRDVRSKV